MKEQINFDEIVKDGRLNLREKKLNQEDASEVADWLKKNHSSLVAIGFGQNPDLGDEGVAEIIQAIKDNQSIEVLGLINTGAGVKAAAAFAEVINTTKIQQVYLGKNQFGDQEIEKIAVALGDNGTLKILGLAENKFTSTVKLAEALRDNKNLEQLYLDRNDITQVEALKQVLITRETPLKLNHLDNEINNPVLKKLNEDVAKAKSETKVHQHVL
jgi:Leucine-rich repeat (LRR) protein